MLGSGLGLYSVEALKRDRKRRKKHTPFSNSFRIYKGTKTQFVFPKASKIQLLAIREKMNKQRRQERDKLIIAFVIAIPVTIGLISGFLKYIF